MATATKTGIVEAVYGEEPATIYQLDPSAVDKDGTEWSHVLVFVRADGGAEVIGCDENGSVTNPQMIALVKYQHPPGANDAGALWLLGAYDVVTS
jgi:hypothetical protein